MRATMYAAIAAMMMCAASAQAAAPELSASRQMRRISLALTNKTPTIDEYEALLAISDEAEQRAFLAQYVQDKLDSAAFERVLLEWSYEYLKLGTYDFRYDNHKYWNANDSIDLRRCPEGTLHEGAYGRLNNLPAHGEPFSICDEMTTLVRDVEPWWAPGTTIPVVGIAGGETTRDGDDLCGGINWGAREVGPMFKGCSCGPNMIYCSRDHSSVSNGLNYPGFHDGEWHDERTQRHHVTLEPAKLFAHIVTQDRPFSDLILGDYTLVTRPLYHMYRRKARMLGEINQALDTQNAWIREFRDNVEWREVKFSEMHPQLLDDRDYRYDPRTDDGPVRGLPSAGILTMLHPNYAHGRERVRAARWLEVFDCYEFLPPAPSTEFIPYSGDPATDGVCKSCHQSIDPAAMFFKRLGPDGGWIGGVGSFTLDQPARRSWKEAQTLLRWRLAFQADTVMTPVSGERLEAFPDAAFLDHLPADGDRELFGTKGDGTIGPLGFAKILVETGRFDRCVARKTYEKFGGRRLSPGQDKALIDEMSEHFVARNRSLRSLIEYVLGLETSRQGL